MTKTSGWFFLFSLIISSSQVAFGRMETAPDDDLLNQNIFPGIQTPVKVMPADESPFLQEKLDPNAIAKTNCFNRADIDPPCENPRPTYSKATEWTDEEVDTYSRATVVAYEKEIGQEEYEKLLKEGWSATTFKGRYGVGGDKAKEAHAGVVFTKGKQVVISYRGSGKPNEAPEDWVTNVRVESTSAEAIGLNGRVHKGFLDAALSSVDAVDEIVNDYMKLNGYTINDMEIVITGHSLGGAIAQVASAYFINKWGIEPGSGQLKLMTLAAPRFANAEAAKDFDTKLGVENHTRLVNYGDPVSSIVEKKLTGEDYKHTGTYIEIRPFKDLGDITKNNFQEVLPQISSLSEALSIAYNDPKRAILGPARVVTGFGAAVWGTLFGAPIKLHEKERYQKGAVSAFQNWREDPDEKRTVRSYVRRAKQIISIPLLPTIIWANTTLRPQYALIEYGLQKTVQGGFYIADNFADGTVGNAVKAIGSGVTTAAKTVTNATVNAAKTVGNGAKKAWGWAKSWF